MEQMAKPAYERLLMWNCKQKCLARRAFLRRRPLLGLRAKPALGRTDLKQ